jgi:hypothetical protein
MKMFFFTIFQSSLLYTLNYNYDATCVEIYLTTCHTENLDNDNEDSLRNGNSLGSSALENFTKFYPHRAAPKGILLNDPHRALIDPNSPLFVLLLIIIILYSLKHVSYESEHPNNINYKH